jgi:hypothetical protein
MKVCGRGEQFSLQPLFLQSLSVVGFEVITAVVMKTPIFSDITPCSLLEAGSKLCFGCCLLLLVSCLPYSSILKMEVTYSSETSVIFSGLHAVISLKTELFFLSLIFSHTKFSFMTKKIALVLT